MDCPICHQSMTAGELSLLHADGMPSVGFTGPSLVFIDSSGEQIPLMEPTAAQPAAFHCGSCGTALLCGQHGTDSTCLQCGQAMPPGVTACRKCGWTYL